MLALRLSNSARLPLLDLSPFSAMIFGTDMFFVKSLAIGIWDVVEYKLDSHLFFLFFFYKSTTPQTIVITGPTVSHLFFFLIYHFIYYYKLLYQLII